MFINEKKFVVPISQWKLPNDSFRKELKLAWENKEAGLREKAIRRIYL